VNARARASARELLCAARMNKPGHLLPLLALAAACTTPPADDIGTFVGGEADVATIRVPLRLDAGETIELALAASAAFQIVTAYAPDGEVELAATDEAGATVTATGRQPTLVVDVPRGVHRPGEEPAYVLAVANRSSADIRGTLTILPAPPTCADDAWIPWLETLVTRLARAEQNGYLESDEQTALDGILAAVPCAATSDAAYVAWHAAFAPRVTRHAANGYLEANELALLDVLVRAAPAATGDTAYLAWLGDWGPRITTASQNGYIESNERAVLDLVVGIRPRATTDASYVGWAGVLEPMLVEAARNGYIESNERDNMLQVIAGKPCASGVDALAAWNRLAAVAANGTADVVAAARPDAGCAP
jgi:hypothetical protein